jgi:uncharacterized protein YecE (DUF72 family)
VARRDAAEPLGIFLVHATVLATKLGPLLVQLPPHFQLDLPWLEASEKDVHVYFNNDREGPAMRDALRLQEMLRLAR